MPRNEDSPAWMQDDRSAAWGRIVRVALLTAAALGALIGSSVQGATWTYFPSYFSHDLPEEAARLHPVPESRSAYRLPIAVDGPGFAVRGGYRWNVMTLQSGNSRDTTIFRENWFEVRP